MSKLEEQLLEDLSSLSYRLHLKYPNGQRTVYYAEAYKFPLAEAIRHIKASRPTARIEDAWLVRSTDKSDRVLAHVDLFYCGRKVFKGR